MEGVEARQEAYLLHSPLKWVDEDESTNFTDETDNFVAINRRLASEDQLNGNFDSPNEGDMPNAIKDPLRDDTTAPKNECKCSIHCMLKYFLPKYLICDCLYS